MAITIKEVEQAIAAIEQPGAFLGVLPKANGVDVLKRSGRLNRQHMAEANEWPMTKVLARLTILYSEISRQ